MQIAQLRRTEARILVNLRQDAVRFQPILFRIAIGLPFIIKLALSGLVLAPPGFLIGMPFPSGLRLVKTVEWAWALNAATSVLGSVMAMIIAIHYGLTVTPVCAAVAYLLAAVCARTRKAPSSASAWTANSQHVETR